MSAVKSALLVESFVCVECGGSGETIRNHHAYSDPQHDLETPCDMCDGHGTIPTADAPAEVQFVEIVFAPTRNQPKRTINLTPRLFEGVEHDLPF